MIKLFGVILNRMIVFIVESGDAGFKIGKGSSTFFVISLIIFDDELEAEETALRIKKLRKQLKKTDKFEFKFNKCNRIYREKFLQEIKNCNFRIRSIIINKKGVYSTHLRDFTTDFYGFSLRMVLQHNNDSIKNAKIRIDGSGERNFRKQLTLYLRKFLNSPNNKVIKNFRFQDSRQNVLIQLADMVAGSIRRSFEHTTPDFDVYRKIIQKREEDTWEFK